MQAQAAIWGGVHYAFICDVDTYVDPKALLVNKPIDKDYVGFRCDEGHAAGGHGYWLSNRACRLLWEANPTTGYADMWVYNVLRQRGIELHHDPRYGDGTITMHLSVNGIYSDSLMYIEHARRL